MGPVRLLQGTGSHLNGSVKLKENIRKKKKHMASFDVFLFDSVESLQILITVASYSFLFAIQTH